MTELLTSAQMRAISAAAFAAGPPVEQEAIQ